MRFSKLGNIKKVLDSNNNRIIKIYFELSINNVAMEFAASITDIVNLFSFWGDTSPFSHLVMFDL